MKQHIKKILKSSLFQRIVAAIGYSYLWFVFKTTRWTYEGIEHLEHFHATNTPFIITFWHGRLTMMPFLWQYTTPFHMLLSEHTDGRLIAQVIAHHGIHSIYGSRTRNGAKAALTCIKLLKSGACVGITPDGPKGPRHDVADGVVHIARLAQAPIVSCTFSLQHARFLSTWDHFLFPLPFGRGHYVIGSPIYVEHERNDDSLNDIKNTIRLHMIDIERRADCF